MSNKQDQKASDSTELNQDQTDEATPPTQSVKKPQTTEDSVDSSLGDNVIIDQQAASVEIESPQAQTGNNIDAATLLVEARKQADTYRNDMLRAYADMENLRRRQMRDLESAHKRALDKFIEELLPICDSMELGIKAADTSDATLASVRDGMQMTIKMFLAAIAKFGLEEVNPQENDAFNPDLHQAMQTQDKEGVPAGQIVTVVQKGYQFNGRLMRPAMVIVSA